jgi:hypothetical protein
MVFLYVAIRLTENETARIVATLRSVSCPETDRPTAKSLLVTKEILRMYCPIRFTAKVVGRCTESLRTNRANSRSIIDLNDLAVAMVRANTATRPTLLSSARDIAKVFL